MAQLFRVAWDALSTAVFPAPCRICQSILDTASRVPLCERCLAAFHRLEAPWCARCGRPVLASASGALEIICRLCRSEVYDFDLARSFAAYDDAMVRAILVLKHEGVPTLGAWFADRIAELAQKEATFGELSLVVPVPLHRARRRERGYNQAELISRPLARRMGLPHVGRALMRTRPRPAALRMTRKQRWLAVRGAFAPRQAAKVDNRAVLLVDDVFTTGATLDACSRALRRAGATRVVALTVARAVPDWRPQDQVPPLRPV